MKLTTPLLPALLAALACGSGNGGIPSDPRPGPDPPTARVVMLVNHVHGMNDSEKAIRGRVEELSGLPVVPISDEDFVEADTTNCRMILLSKTVDDAIIHDRIKSAPCGIFSWEENAQTLQTLALVRSHGEDRAFWHQEGQQVHVLPEAPEALSAGLKGMVDFYLPLDSVPHISYGKREDMVDTHATLVAEFERPGYHNSIYYFDRGDTLADGTPAAARRLFFGLHRDTYRHLSPEGRSLFDAAIRWTLETGESDPVEESDSEEGADPTGS